MAGSLRDQLLALGLGKNSPAKEPARDARPGGPRKPSGGKPGDRAQGNGGDRAQGKGGAPARPDRERSRDANRQQRPRQEPSPPRGGGEPDLAQAYAARARAEREERERAEREAQQKARERKERRDRMNKLLEGQARNVPEADEARHFNHGGKIRRVYVTGEQRLALNSGELGVVQWNGRYILVAREIALAARDILEESLALLPEPGASGEDDIPPDLTW